MRTKNTIKNIYISIVSQIIMTLLGFISRKVFIDNLGANYLGINGLLINVLSMLSLVEGGIGTSIVYNLYKPLAEKDEDRIIALVQLYKKLYSILAVVVFFLSFALYPFLGEIIKGGESIPNILIVYYIFVIKNVISYLNSHKWSLINADQKAYILARMNLIFDVITTISKIVVLVLTKNYILFLLIELAIFTFKNIYNGNIVNKRYSYIKTKKKYKIDDGTKDNLITNVKAIFFHQIGTYCVYGTDNILISTFISLSTVGLYSNYTMVIGQLSALIIPILSGIDASVGNLIATESEERSYEVFKITYLINFWIYSVLTIFLYNLLQPFINWWLGKGLLLDSFTFIIILINFYLVGLRVCVNTFKSKGGIFTQDKYMPLLESAINLGVGLILVKYIGLAGIFIGTTISTLSITFWNQPRLIYKNIFKKSVKDYFKRYIVYVVLTVIAGTITTIICNFTTYRVEFISLVLKGFACLIIPNLLFVLVFYRTEEFKYLLNLVNAMLRNMKSKVYGKRKIIIKEI